MLRSLAPSRREVAAAFFHCPRNAHAEARFFAGRVNLSRNRGAFQGEGDLEGRKALIPRETVASGRVFRGKRAPTFHHLLDSPFRPNLATEFYRLL